MFAKVLIATQDVQQANVFVQQPHLRELNANMVRLL